MCSFGKEGICLMQHRTESRLKVSRAHAANYRDGPMYNGLVDVVCPTHILAKREVRPNPLEPPPPPPCIRPCTWYYVLCATVQCSHSNSINSAKSVSIQNSAHNYATWVCHKLKTRLLIVAFCIVTILVLAFYTTDPDILSLLKLVIHTSLVQQQDI